MGIRFADDTFEASSVRGDYRQRGRRLRLSVEDALLDEWEALWEEDFADHLRQAGDVVDRVRCRTTSSELKGRARRGGLRFRMRHKFRCRASGNFRTRRAKIEVRFEGRGRAGVLADFDQDLVIQTYRGSKHEGIAQVTLGAFLGLHTT